MQCYRRKIIHMLVECQLKLRVLGEFASDRQTL